MKDTFQCTPELLCEFFDSLPRGSSVGDIFYYWDKFKSSKAPKKEWEIVAFKQGGKIFETYIDGGSYRDQYGNPINLFSELAHDLFIHSVRRLSDGEVFSVGDRILSGTIIKIEKTDKSCDGLLLRTGEWTTPITCAEKLLQKVFTTIDGVDIYEDGNFWHVNEDWTLSNFGVSTEFIDYSKPDKDFSTREAAETYILQNRPLLSLNDVKEALAASFCGEAALEKLTALVKQKLNP